MKKQNKLNQMLAYRAEEALKKAVAKAIAEDRRNGVPIAIWREGQVSVHLLMRSESGILRLII